MDIVNEDTTLVVGKIYNVQCAKMVSKYNPELFYYMPIIGIPHTDKQFSVVHHHYHIDGRFTGFYERRTGIIISDKGYSNNICVIDDKIGGGEYRCKEVVVKRKKCKRLTTGILPPEIIASSNSGVFYKWVKEMKGKSCKGKKCPHLGTKMLEVDGELVCPLHNLLGDKKTEVIIGIKTYPRFN